jgi:hypothetical protein
VEAKKKQLSDLFVDGHFFKPLLDEGRGL